jgi:hypothetical protein
MLHSLLVTDLYLLILIFRSYLSVSLVKTTVHTNIALPNITHILRKNLITLEMKKKILLIVYHAGDSAVMNKTDRCGFWGQRVYFEMRDLLH